VARLVVRDAEIAFDQVGHGDRDVLLVHGFQQARSGWVPFVDRVDLSRVRITTFDLVGCGESARATAAARCTIDEYACDLLTLCDELELASPVVMGHSLGGATAIQAALDDPDRFSALVLVAPASTTGLDFVADDDAFERLSHPTPEDQRLLARAAFARPLSPTEFEALMDVIAQATPEHIEGAATSMRGFDRRSDLARIRVPTLLVCGDRDRHVPLRNHLATQQAIPKCGLQVYFDVGHVPFIETPDRFAADVTHFLDTAVAQR
jgi:pimeloyl-ACP methyl ester carboxylesterase